MELSIATPDDWHVHFRDGRAVGDVVREVSRQFGRALAMPNLRPPLRTCAEALAYRRRILQVAPEGFEVVATLYLTEQTTVGEILEAAASPSVVGVKFYPAGATTHSEDGISDLATCEEVLSAMEESGLPLLVHGEVVDDGVDIFDREERFLDEVLAPLVARHPRLKVVLEHITTRAAVDFVNAAGPSVAATITAHHLLHTRNDLLVGGIRPHFYCLPVLKRSQDRRALLEAATGERRRFFLGTDSAPHEVGRKESACGCAGCYTSPVALALYATAFEENGALDRLEDFASRRGADFYGLPYNGGRVRLRREKWEVPASMPFGAGRVIPFAAGRTLTWTVTGRDPI